MQTLLKTNQQALTSICKTLQVKRMYVFGSATSDRFNEQSDLDFLIAFSDRLSVQEYTNNYFALHQQLQELFNREIDLVTERTLSNPYFIESINESKELIYEA